MLVLSRKVGEEIVIGGRVRVRVANVRGRRVQLAIAAPASISIHRQEIYENRREFGQTKKQLPAPYPAPTIQLNGRELIGENGIPLPQPR